MTVAPLQVHPDADQALRDPVVQVAGDPVALGAHQLRLPGPREAPPRSPELHVAAGGPAWPGVGAAPSPPCCPAGTAVGPVSRAARDAASSGEGGLVPPPGARRQVKWGGTADG